MPCPSTSYASGHASFFLPVAMVSKSTSLFQLCPVEVQSSKLMRFCCWASFKNKRRFGIRDFVISTKRFPDGIRAGMSCSSSPEPSANLMRSWKRTTGWAVVWVFAHLKNTCERHETWSFPIRDRLLVPHFLFGFHVVAVWIQNYRWGDAVHRWLERPLSRFRLFQLTHAVAGVRKNLILILYLRFLELRY